MTVIFLYSMIWTRFETEDWFCFFNTSIYCQFKSSVVKLKMIIFCVFRNIFFFFLFFLTAYTHLTKVIDASRVSLFDIITQYNAIFSDNEPLYTSTSSNDGNRHNNASILHSWVLTKVCLIWMFVKTFFFNVFPNLFFSIIIR